MKSTAIALTAMLLVALAPAGTVAQPDNPTTYQDPIVRSIRRAMPVIRGLKWRVRTDYRITRNFRRPVATGDGMAFFVKDETIVAADPRTGKRHWAAGRGMLATLLYHDHRVHVPAADGAVHAFDSRTGRPIWSSALRIRDIESLQAVRDTLFVNSYSDGLAAVSVRTGRLRWHIQRAGSAGPRGWDASIGPQAVAGDVVLAAFTESGAITVRVIYAFELRTGEQLWRLPGEGRLLKVQGDRLYFQDVWFNLGQADRLKIDIVQAETGKFLRSRTYVVKSTGPNVHARWRKVILQDDGLFVDMKYAVYRLSLRDPATPPAVYRAPGAPRVPPTFTGYVPTKDSMWVAGPHDGKLFFSDGRQLDAVFLAGGKTLSYEGVTGRISRLEIIGNRIYVGQLDGWFMILDLRTRKTLLRANTGARIFNAFFVLEGLVLVQAEDELLAFPAP